MEPFRSVRGGGARARLAAAEASLLRSLVGQIMSLVESSPADNPAHEQDDDLAALEAMLHGPGADKIPEDPVLARLLPDAYRDDTEAAGEFRRFTEQELRSGKLAAAQTVLDTLPEEGGRVELTEEDGQVWLRALNDVRLALGVRLDITEDTAQRTQDLDPADPRAAYLWVYDWLTYLQETLVRALW